MIQDLSFRERAILAPLSRADDYFGVHPGPVLDSSVASITALIQTMTRRSAVTKTAALAFTKG